MKRQPASALRGHAEASQKQFRANGSYLPPVKLQTCRNNWLARELRKNCWLQAAEAGACPPFSSGAAPRGCRCSLLTETWLKHPHQKGNPFGCIRQGPALDLPHLRLVSDRLFGRHFKRRCSNQPRVLRQGKHCTLNPNCMRRHHMNPSN